MTANLSTNLRKLSVFFILVNTMVQKNADCDQKISGVYKDSGHGHTVINLLSHREKRELYGGFSGRRLSNDTETSSARWIRRVFDLNKMESNDSSLAMIKHSDLIMTFGESFRRDNELWFDHEEVQIPEVDRVIRAELHVQLSRGGRASLYDFDPRDDDEVLWRLVDSVQADPWGRLNATGIVKRWIRGTRKSLQGLKIESEDGEFEEAFVAAYFARSNKFVSETTKTKPMLSTPDPEYSIKRSPDHRRDLCKLHKLFVNFKDIGVENIVAPEGYEASFCQGDCSFPLNVQADNQTAHSIVQALMAFQNPGKVPQACCSPDEYEDLSVVYSDVNGTYRFTRYSNMIVKSCRCS